MLTSFTKFTIFKQIDLHTLINSVENNSCQYTANIRRESKTFTCMLYSTHRILVEFATSLCFQLIDNTSSVPMQMFAFCNYYPFKLIMNYVFIICFTFTGTANA